MLVAPARSQSESDLRDELVRRAAETGLTPQQTQSILARADRLEADGLPAGAVLDRYLEGLAKGIALPRIEAVVDQLEDRLRDSGRRVDAVFPANTPAKTPVNDRAARLALIDHAAYALEVGVPGAVIEQAMRLAAADHEGPAQGQAAVLAMGGLVAGGIKPDVSLDLVSAAWTQGYRGADLEKLGTDLGGLARNGQGPPADVLRQVLDSIRSGADRDKLLRSLDQMLAGGPSGPGDHPPGTRPGEDPSDQHGPGGNPSDPGHMGPGGRDVPPDHGRDGGPGRR